MNSEVEIAPFKDDEDVLFKMTRNPDYVSIRLKQDHLELNGNFLNERSVCSYMVVSSAVIRKYNLEIGMKWKDIIGMDCKIIVKESTTPFYAGQEPKINPRTNAIYHHTESNLPIYRTAKVTVILSEVDDVYSPEEVTIINNARSTTNEFSSDSTSAFERSIE